MAHEPSIDGNADVTLSIWLTGVCVFVPASAAELHVVMPWVTGKGNSVGIPPHSVLLNVEQQYIREGSDIQGGTTVLDGYSIDVPRFPGDPLRLDLPPETADLTALHPDRRVPACRLMRPFAGLAGHLVLRSGRYRCYARGARWLIGSDSTPRHLPYRVEWVTRVPGSIAPELRLRPFADQARDLTLRLQPVGGVIKLDVGHVPREANHNHHEPHLRALVDALEPLGAAVNAVYHDDGDGDKETCDGLAPTSAKSPFMGELFTCMYGRAGL
ncbi:MAG: hypothetical protein ACXW0Z_20960 [Gemmatirosa sp.]